VHALLCRDRSPPVFDPGQAPPVGDWIAEHGGFAAVLDLLAQRAKGTPFASLYGRERERPALPSSSSTALDDDDTD
jgi:hypothetical protein